MRPLVALTFVIGLSACTPQEAREPKPKAGTAQAKKDETMVIATGKVEVLAKDEKGQTVLAVRATGSNIEVGEKVGVSELKAVDGEIYEAGKLKSRFRADRGTVDQVNRLIFAKGNVVVKDPVGSLALRADTIRYQDGTDRIEARGRVTVSSESWKFGPFADLYATPDLQRVATPDRFP